MFYKNSPAENKNQTYRNSEGINVHNNNNKNNNLSNAEYLNENTENNFSLAKIEIPDENYEALQTGNFKIINPIFAKIQNKDLENNKRISTENIRLDSFKSESLYKRNCFFCARNRENLLKKLNFHNKENTSNKDNNLNTFNEFMTEKLKILMKSFNIERRFTDKLDENRDLCDKLQNEEFKNSLAEMNSYNFNNYYPKNLSFILLDLRISVDKKDKFCDYKAGFLPMTVVVEQEELTDDHVKLIKL